MARKSGRANFYQRNLGWPHLISALSASLLFFVAGHTNILQNAEFNTLDTRFKLRGAVESPGNVVIVGIDQQSYNDIGLTWPWPRSLHAKLLENLTEAGASVVIFDVIFDVPDNDPRNDGIFAEAIRAHGSVILGAKREELQGEVLGNRFTYPIPVLREAARAIGLVDRLEDTDGFTRRYGLFVPTETAPLLALGTAAIRALHGIDQDAGIVERGNSVEVGPHLVPRLDSTTIMINYLGGPGTIPTYSYSSVIDDADFDMPAGMDVDAFDFQKDLFKDKIVIVGATMHEMHDFVRTPFYEDDAGQRRLTPGAEMHASAIESILSERFYWRLGRWQDVTIMLFLTLLVAGTAVRLKPLNGLLTVLGLSVGYTLIALLFFINYRLMLDVVTPVGAMLVSHGGSTFYYFIRERKDKQKIRGMFARYVPEEVVKVLMEDPGLMNLGGEERELSILFSDLAGFTTFSEGLTPTELVTLLNEYLSEMTDFVKANGGIIDKFEGDLIMAEFGAPLHDPEHALKGCRAALAMDKRLAEMRAGWIAEGRPPLHARIGLNTGRVVLGNLGSRDLQDYTVLGDAVNLASRLEGANKGYGSSICISEFTYEQAKSGVIARELDWIQVKGKAKAVTIFELMALRSEGLNPGAEKAVAEYAAGLEAYRAQDWDEAEARFVSAIANRGADPPSEKLLDRVKFYRLNPPGEDWNGVYVMTSK